MQKILYIFILIGIVSCGQAPVSQNSKTDTVKSAKQKTPENKLKQQILGVWTSNVDGINVVLEIKPDSIYYVEHDVSNKYT